MKTRVAVLQHHDDYATFKVVRLAAGQSEDFDEGSATRRWLRPHLGDDYHLMAFVDLEDQEESFHYFASGTMVAPDGSEYPVTDIKITITRDKGT